MIDEPTLMTVLGVASLIAGAMFLVLAAFARNMPGIRLWAAACLLVGLATVVDAPRLITDWQLASMLFNIPISIGQALILAGTMQFCRLASPYRVLSVLTVVAVIITVTFTYLVPDTVLRIAALTLLQAFTNAWNAWILWRHRERLARHVYLAASLTSLFQCVATLAQGLLIMTSSVAVTYGAPQIPLANIISWSGAMIGTLLGNWMLFLLVMLRLVSDLRGMAERDVLTGLLNRRGLRRHVDKLMLRAPEAGVEVGVLLLDVDHFKAINDRHGHEAGDDVLAAMGEILLAASGPEAVACRWGGEEFCMLLDRATPQSALAAAERIRARFHACAAQGTALPQGPTVSIGVALMALDARFEMSKLVAAADAQLYRAKSAGRDRVAAAYVADATRTGTASA